MMVPLLTVVGMAIAPSDDIWHHLAETVLWDYVSTTAILTIGVGIGVTVIGAGTAWLVTMCKFPARGIFN